MSIDFVAPSKEDLTPKKFLARDPKVHDLLFLLLSQSDSPSADTA